MYEAAKSHVSLKEPRRVVTQSHILEMPCVFHVFLLHNTHPAAQGSGCVQNWSSTVHIFRCYTKGRVNGLAETRVAFLPLLSSR